MSGFGDVAGHEEIIQYIRGAVAHGRVSHAYILSGAKGSGKKLLSKLFAMTLQCESGQTEPCGKCRSCIQAESGNHPDIITVTHEKPGSISVGEIRRQLVEDIDIRPYTGPYKIYIIPDAHLMVDEAQNAILKTLEEPPSYGVIFLLTENPDSLFPTILSRCVTLKLHNIKDSLVRKYLMDKVRVPDYQAQVCAAFSQGNIGRAVMLASSEHFNEIMEEALFILRHADEMNLNDIVKSTGKAGRYKLEITDYLDIFSIWYRDVLIYKATMDARRVVFTDRISDIRKKASKSSYEGIGNILRGIERAKERLRANVNFDLVMELLMLTMQEN